MTTTQAERKLLNTYQLLKEVKDADLKEYYEFLAERLEKEVKKELDWAIKMMKEHKRLNGGKK